MSVAATPSTVVLEPAAQEFADATSTPPFIYQLSPEEAREVLESVQRSPIEKPDVEIDELTIAGGPQGQIAVRLIKPAGATGTGALHLRFTSRTRFSSNSDRLYQPREPTGTGGHDRLAVLACTGQECT